MEAKDACENNVIYFRISGYVTKRIMWYDCWCQWQKNAYEYTVVNFHSSGCAKKNTGQAEDPKVSYFHFSGFHIIFLKQQTKKTTDVIMQKVKIITLFVLEISWSMSHRYFIARKGEQVRI